ncbi:membrane protein [Streptomyces incarnatus]|uniref:Membrane protein n=1 Tax=Streptomyces incarnatus TaxID=665007 RepID=A0ABM5TM06_9ACTN|nr:class E sortase [Streptomyces incarnatus]AKJ12034.1 membrane protein [Streptomyces incarnatus]
MTALRPERETDASYGDQSYEASGALGDWDAAGVAHQERYSEPYGGPHGASRGGSHDASSSRDPYGGSYDDPYPYRDDARPALDDETMALRIAGDPPSSSGGEATGASMASRASSASSAAGPAAGGRAARRRAAKRRGGRHGGRREAAPAEPAGTADSAGPGRPLSRVEARRQARLRKPSPGVIVSRAIGEVFITTGVLMLLFVTYQLWWTNIRAHAQAGSETHQLQDDWASGKRNPGVFEPGQGFAILHIPKLDVVAPIAEGVSKAKVLDKGMVGHYGEPPLKTAMPDARTGNFGLAAHRNTHGEPFRYINKLKPGDAVVVETQDEYYVYKVTSTLPVTSPSNTSVLDPVPKGSGFTQPGRYITLTTCTPEFTSKYRLVVWGKMVEERPRSKGKPDALIE